jgi:uncharacterized protein (TIGR03663 family)
MRRRLADRSQRELAFYVALILLALVLRLVDLGSRPFHHDESQDAFFSFTRAGFEYNPLLHGPLRFYLTSAMFAVFGASDFSARLAPALLGTAMVGLPYLLRDQIGRVAAATAAVLLAVGPSYLYFSRFAREDIYIACITLGMLVVVLRLLDGPRPWHPPVLLGLLAASFATKESTFITVFVAGTYLGPLALVQAFRARRRGASWRDAPILRTVGSLGGEAWAWGAAAFAGVFTLLFTVFLTYPSGLWAGIHDGLDYWLSQQPVARGGEPPGFYVFLLFGMEWPVLALGALGVLAVARRPTVGGWLLVWMFLGSLAVYSWASEKFAWLVLHPLLPLILLAGLGVQLLWATRERWAGRAGLAVAALAFLYTGYASFQANARSPADPRELLVSTQSSVDTVGVRDEVLAIARRTERPLTVTVDAAEGATFPWAWYFRDLPASYVDLQQEGAEAPQGDVMILTDATRTQFAPRLDALYEARRFNLRVWWVKDYDKAWSPRHWVEYMVTREPWNATGGMPEWLYVRRDLAP